MTILLSEQLASFQENDYSVRTVRGLLGILPFVPNWHHSASLEAAAARMDPELASRVAARAEQLAQTPERQAALKAFELIDKGDKGIALFSGLKGVVQGVRGTGGALEMDPQQAADASLKAVGVAYAAWKLYPGTAQEKANALTTSDAGQALLAFYVAVDIVLPFADNLASGGISMVTGLIDSQAAEQAARLAPGAEAEQAVGMLRQLSGTLQNYVGKAATFAQPLSAWVQEKLPGMLGTADKLTGVMATAVDTLATYQYLGAALVAENCLQQALTEVRAEVAAEKAAAERAKQEAEEKRRQMEEAALAQAEAARKEREEEARKRAERSKQREDYSLDAPEAAASLSASPIKYTRSTDVAPSEPKPPAKGGCMGCMGVIAFFILAGSLSTVAWAAW